MLNLILCQDHGLNYKNMLTEINYKVVSYCEIPEEITEKHPISENSNDSYVTYTLVKFHEDELYKMTPLDAWLYSNYPELIGTIFMIYLDY